MAYGIEGRQTLNILKYEYPYIVELQAKLERRKRGAEL
jgi:hypothetical protein